jgi:hypothetical protein
VVFVTADENTTNLTATDSGYLTASMNANGFVAGIFEFEAFLKMNSSSSAGVKVSINCSQSTISQYIIAEGASSGTTTAALSTWQSLNTLGPTAYCAFTGSDGLIIMKGQLLISSSSTANTFTVQYAKVTSGTATVRVGSSLKIKKIR